MKEEMEEEEGGGGGGGRGGGGGGEGGRKRRKLREEYEDKSNPEKRQLHSDPDSQEREWRQPGGSSRE